MENPLADLIAKYKPVYGALLEFEKLAGPNGSVRQVWNSDHTKLYGVVVFRDVNIPSVLECHVYTLKSALKNVTVQQYLKLMSPPMYGGSTHVQVYTVIPPGIATARICRALGFHEWPERTFIWNMEDVRAIASRWPAGTLVRDLFRSRRPR